MPTHQFTEPYPEHAKLDAVQPQSQACGEFLDWLKQEKDFVLCEWGDRPDGSQGDYTPVRASTTDLLYEFFGIDPKVIEAEKRDILDKLRAMNEAKARS